MSSVEDCPVIESLKQAATIQPVQDIKAEKYGRMTAWGTALGIPLILLVISITSNSLINSQTKMNETLAELNISMQLQGQRMDFFADKVEELEKADARIIVNIQDNWVEFKDYVANGK